MVIQDKRHPRAVRSTSLVYTSGYCVLGHDKRMQEASHGLIAAETVTDMSGLQPFLLTFMLEAIAISSWSVDTLHTSAGRAADIRVFAYTIEGAPFWRYLVLG